MYYLKELEEYIDYHITYLHKIEDHYNNLIIEEFLKHIRPVEDIKQEEPQDENRLIHQFVNHPEFKHIFEIWYEHLLIETQPNTKDTSYSKLCFEYDPNDISDICKKKIYEVYNKYNGYNVIPRLTRYIN